MIRLTNLLREDDDQNNNGYPDSSETPHRAPYQTLAQQGELPGLDPEMDTEYLNGLISTLEYNYNQVRYRRIDMTNFKQDLLDLFEKYKTITRTENDRDSHASFHREFESMYPIAKTHTSWKGIANQITSSLRALWNLSKSIAAGDTSNIGYRVMKWQRDNPHKLRR